MWLEFVYQPTTLFSLKASDATNSASKSLFSPSPYAVKMALLNAICTFDSVTTAERHFNLIRDLEIQFALPEYVVVNNCFIKIIKKDDHPKVPEDLFKSTVAFREFVYFSGELKIAVGLPSNTTQAEINILKIYFGKINYFGKRASFFQLTDFYQERFKELPDEYSREWNLQSLSKIGSSILVKMDEFGLNVKFENVNSYSEKKTNRTSKVFILPLKMIKANKNFTIFQRV